ncbi:hypothetical protein CAOG_00080 [Capsaspora owczarzaki ATCC 30864]|uniref:Zona occludens toxin N-terminal domain-containing protein n=1 Tax=Capsaspora owczarzaki (strain ATCC 30864) TaxID=595528 RepID=A0A0D2VFC2_CAPO3|nr:hypothetical protein CAOG_00080 [Capsaspora owczarzaki ATCC 30864]KJE88422.1 hypothetical protein CAOG_000080 [Capsaspora owczarzaki ATCC 30864]|eukprot:XP_004364951.1 hypothetical protein CAOG_00080 [Capsaspora owczarzaki ATCC 30864]
MVQVAAAAAASSAEPSASPAEVEAQRLATMCANEIVARGLGFPASAIVVPASIPKDLSALFVQRVVYLMKQNEKLAASTVNGATFFTPAAIPSVAVAPAAAAASTPAQPPPPKLNLEAIAQKLAKEYIAQVLAGKAFQSSQIAPPPSLSEPERKSFRLRVIFLMQSDARIAHTPMGGACTFSPKPGAVARAASGAPSTVTAPTYNGSFAGPSEVPQSPAKPVMPAMPVTPVTPASAGKKARPAIVVATTDASVDVRTYDEVIQRGGIYEDASNGTEGVVPSHNVFNPSAGMLPSAGPPLTLEQKLTRHFFDSPVAAPSQKKIGFVLGDRMSARQQFAEAAYLGMHRPNRTANDQGENVDETPEEGANEIFLNTHEPFCLVAVGVQGAGKSHTMSVVLENCLVPNPHPAGREIVRLNRPMAGLVLHYDQNTASVCEATGLISPDPSLQISALPRDKLVVLVSPSYYHQRRKFYGAYCTVKPLLFRWSTLSADHIKKLMRIKDTDSQLYVSSMLDLLRRYQRDNKTPDFQGFMEQVREKCQLPGQGGALEQRASFLEAMVAESSLNQDLRASGADLLQCIAPGSLVVADLTDPLLSRDEANGIFQVLTEQFRTAHVSGGKILALDEAHKFMNGLSTDGLSNAIVDAARLMRHDGMRVIVSTQSPKALAPELLELVSVAMLHRFHSHDWLTYLDAKLPLGDLKFEQIMDLPPGSAQVIVNRHLIEQAQGQHQLCVAVRPRMTADRGSSRVNRA